MKLKVTEQIEKEIEIELPKYYSHGNIMKVNEDGSYIMVGNQKNETAITFRKDFPEMVNLYMTKGTEITEQEFLTEFNKAKETINNL